ncbi:helix-turn-helix domain-containing protein [Pelagibius sp.]|uniref:helix-turn-helix domain-containing protein n=1 Tax=Pelagibius sp. TaxID=1931238 RepID=UPI003BB1668A
MSPRYLQSLFSIEGVSPSRWIWTRRLERCREDLEDPKLAKTSITTISYGWGFNDSTHFSRAFKKRFGQSPRDFRRASQSRRQNQTITPATGPLADNREDVTLSAL